MVAMRRKRRLRTGCLYECRLELDFLRTELGRVAPAQLVDNPLPESGRVLVRERPLRRLELDGEGDRLAALAHLRAAVDVERAHLAELRAPGLARRLDQRGGRHVLVHNERQVLLDGRERDDVLVLARLARAGDERAKVEFERAPRAVEERRVQLADDACL